MNFRERYIYDPVKDLLGKGGFSSVYAAYDKLLERPVALKFFHAEAPDKYSLLEEIKRVIRLSHPNIVRYYDVAEIESVSVHGTTVKVQAGILEYINGGEIKEFLSNNNDRALLVKLLEDILSGIAYLHQNKIVHRDLKPQNILVQVENDQATAKISDFGISKIFGPGKTATVGIVGTPDYMAPEQFNNDLYGGGDDITNRVDLWSFGVLAYELITGEKLFNTGGSNFSERTINALLNENIDQKINAVDAVFRPLLKRCLVRDARKRAASAEELIALLPGKNHKEQQPVAASTKSNKGKRVLLSVFAVLLVASGVFLFLQNRTTRTEAIPVKQTPPVVKAAPATPVKTPEIKDTPSAPPVVHQETTAPAQPSKPYTVTVVTNANGTLSVNKKPVSAVTPSSKVPVQLNQGNHLLQVSGANPADVILQNVTVTPKQLGKNGELFFDLKKVIKEREDREADDKLKNCRKCNGTGFEEYIAENPCIVCKGLKVRKAPCEADQCTGGKIPVDCKTCNGYGTWISGGVKTVCTQCNGKGFNLFDCPLCDKGFINAPCDHCKGAGMVKGKRVCTH
ncbi:MAG: hypothetical protein Fur0041_12290 [Bacteroidia bacterium]